MTAQTPTPDNTRRDTIEECARIAEKQDAPSCSGSYRQCARNIACYIRALASAEPQVREPSVVMSDPCAYCGATKYRSPCSTQIAADNCHEPRPAPAPSAETEGLVERLTRELEEAKAVIIEANNSLYGSRGYFLSLNGGPADKYHLSRGIEDSKEYGRKQWIENERARAQLAARTQPPEIAEALAMARIEAIAECVALVCAKAGENQTIADSSTAEKAVPALHIACALLDAASSLADLQSARRLLASTGSRQEPAALAEAPSGPRYLIRKRGSYYRPNAQGYTTDVAKAGLFSKERAEQEARVEPGIIRAIPLTPDLLAALRSKPASRESGEAMREACAKVCDAEAEVAESLLAGADGHTDRLVHVAHRASARNLARAIRALPTSHSGSAS